MPALIGRSRPICNPAPSSTSIKSQAKQLIYRESYPSPAGASKPNREQSLPRLAEDDPRREIAENEVEQASDSA